MNTQQDKNNFYDCSSRTIKMLGLFGPSKHSTLKYLEPWMIKDIFSSSNSKSKMK